MLKQSSCFRKATAWIAAIALFVIAFGMAEAPAVRAQEEPRAESVPINCPPTMGFGDVAQCSILTPAEGDSYAFSANAGDKVLLKMSKASGDIWPEIKIYSPGGIKLCEDYASESAEIPSCNLTSTGTYTILASDHFGIGTGDYYLYLQRLNNPGNSTPIAFGQTFFGSVLSPAEMGTFTFTGNSGDRILVKMSMASGDIWPEIKIYGPGGIKLCESYSSESAEIASCTLTTTGTHTILASDHFGIGTGDYYLYLQRLNNPGNSTPIAFGQTLFGSVLSPAEMDAFTFTGNSGDRILVNMGVASGDIWPEVKVYSPDGIKLCEDYSSDSAEIASCSLTSTGTHMILASDYYGIGTGDYYLYLQRLNNPGNSTLIAFGQTLFGSILSPAEMDAFTFTTNYPGKAIIRMSKSVGTLWPEVRVYNPQGIKICEAYSMSSAEIASCNLTSAGTYTILAHDYFGGETGDYYLFLQWLNITGNPVSISGNAGAAGVKLNYLDGTPRSVLSDALGFYSITVPSGWSGRVTPSKAGVVGFFPAFRDYSSVTFNQTAQDFKLKTPVTFRSVGARDGWILELAENANAGQSVNGAATTLRLGDDAARRQYRSILSFYTGVLPDNAVITKVTLMVKRQGIAGGSDPVALLQGFMLDIRRGTFGTAPLLASDWQANANKTFGPFMPALTGGWYTFNLNSARTFINTLATGGGATQIRMRFKLDDNDDAVANYLSLYSGEAGAASRPQLIVEYYIP